MRTELWQYLTGCTESVAQALAKGWQNPRVEIDCSVDDIDDATEARREFQFMVSLTPKRPSWSDRVLHGRHLAPTHYKAIFADDEIPF